MRVLCAVALGLGLLALGCDDPPPAPPIDGSIDTGVGDDEPDTWPELGLGESYNETHDGLRLIMSYDQSRGLFLGTVQNLTAQTLSTVRVTVRISTGATLGPTTPVDLPAGDNAPVSLPDGGRIFTSWGPRVEFSTGSP